MVALLYAMDLVDSEESKNFIVEVYKKTSSFMIAQKTRESLLEANITPPPRVVPPVNLHVPDQLIVQKEPIKATMETSKGKIFIELFPDIAPATVSNR